MNEFLTWNNLIVEESSLGEKIIGCIVLIALTYGIIYGLAKLVTVILEKVQKPDRDAWNYTATVTSNITDADIDYILKVYWVQSEKNENEVIEYRESSESEI